MPFNGSIWYPYEVLGNQTNITSIGAIGQYDNQITGGVFGLVLLVSFFVVCFMALSYREEYSALPVSLFLTTILSYLMAAIDMLADEVAWAATVLLAIGAVIYMYARRSG